ncbi:HAMP domain-containing histidine kinase [Kibdelosporangium philippinense]|uniref:histidine kinase n=1 Tax=Kibdelosporangium philippinense TaxID=211113 RepID=A0ABS8ZPP4_9PSEU|nr:HAMP domain-containing sensor histidine kinase [Kibdelosporangium philippinense]MCE7009695.1 HAMP domain-containing histidine kinase [Kibdelosporangium philippinense]
MTTRRGLRLRVRITLLATGLAAAVSVMLLWLGWLLAGDVVGSVPTLPGDTPVVVNGRQIDASELAKIMQNDVRERILVFGGIAFAAVVAAAALLSWTLTGRILRPLREVTMTARRLSAESLSSRIAYDGPRDELAELADTFDAMLARLQAAFESQRRFVANASHELRTPLSVIRTELDVTLADPDADVAELRRMAGVVRAATLRSGQLVDALLLLARTDGMGLGVREPVDLASTVATAWHGVRAEAEPRGITPTFHAAPAPAIGDPALLERVAGNLLENAVRHNVDGGWIDVRTSANPEWATLRVSSSGPHIDATRVGELFEPFRRGGVDRTAQSGTGLGLSIVRAVVIAHHGQVSAYPVPEGGLSVEVHLPAKL